MLSYFGQETEEAPSATAETAEDGAGRGRAAPYASPAALTVTMITSGRPSLCGRTGFRKQPLARPRPRQGVARAKTAARMGAQEEEDDGEDPST